MAPVAGGQRVRGILHDGQAVPPRQLSNRVQVDWVPGEMDRDEAARARGDAPFDLQRIDVERVGLDIGEDRTSSHVLDHIHRSGEGHGGSDHLVARPNPKRDERGV